MTQVEYIYMTYGKLSKAARLLDSSVLTKVPLTHLISPGATIGIGISLSVSHSMSKNVIFVGIPTTWVQVLVCPVIVLSHIAHG